MKHATALFAVGLALAACGENETFPVKAAPASRHDALRAAIIDDARGFGFAGGDWLEDLGDAPFYGLATLSRRTDLDDGERARRDAALARAEVLLSEDLVKGDLQEKVMAELGAMEHVAATGDRRLVPPIESFLDRLDGLMKVWDDDLAEAADASWAIQVYGPTAVTALVALASAQHALLVGGPAKEARLARAKSLDAMLRARYVRDLTAPTGRTVRGYAIGPDRSDLDLYPNVAMAILKARLYRLTRDEGYKLEARALHAAIQPLEVSSAPVRYASPYAAEALGAAPLDVSTLSSQAYVALSLLFLFEITGERRFVDEADGVFDGIAAMRGPWCTSQVHDPAACAPACTAGSACTLGACEADRCTTGLLHHVVQGHLATPGQGTLFCAGCSFETLYALGTRRALAHEPF